MVYLPLSRLLSLYVQATQQLYRATDTFLGHHQTKVPYIIGIAGSVAVGKSTTARILQTLLARWPSHPKVDLITTDGFLYPNKVLEQRGLMRRKGFPESYDQGRLVRFSWRSNRAKPRCRRRSTRTIPTTSSKAASRWSSSPDIVIVEGLNVLQTGNPGASPRRFVSDFFDFSVFVDAPAELIERWYVERFMTFRQDRVHRPASYFHRYAHLSDETVARNRPRASGPRSTASTCAKTSSRPRKGPISSSRRAPTTRSPGSTCAGCSPRPQPRWRFRRPGLRSARSCRARRRPTSRRTCWPSSSAS